MIRRAFLKLLGLLPVAPELAAEVVAPRLPHCPRNIVCAIRWGPGASRRFKELVKRYAGEFYCALATEHPEDGFTMLTLRTRKKPDTWDESHYGFLFHESGRVHVLDFAKDSNWKGPI